LPPALAIAVTRQSTRKIRITTPDPAIVSPFRWLHYDVCEDAWLAKSSVK
jgi:hypothetical protein